MNHDYIITKSRQRGREVWKLLPTKSGQAKVLGVYNPLTGVLSKKVERGNLYRAMDGFGLNREMLEHLSEQGAQGVHILYNSKVYDYDWAHVYAALKDPLRSIPPAPDPQVVLTRAETTTKVTA